jgi:hypothetical protein
MGFVLPVRGIAIGFAVVIIVDTGKIKNPRNT